MFRETSGKSDRAEGEARTLTRREALAALAAASVWPWVEGSARAASVAGAGAGVGPAARGRAIAELPPRTVGLRSLGGDFRFDPPGLLVSRGDRVAFLNMGDFHTVTAFHPDNAGLLSQPVPLRMPEGAEPFHSGMLGLDAGSVFEHSFEIEGVYDYFCQPHYAFGMVGRIVVGGARGGPAVTGDDSVLPPVVREELPAVEALAGSAGRGFEWAGRINGVLLLRIRKAGAGGAAEALAETARADEALAAALRDRGSPRTFFDRLDSFVDSVMDGAAYETLVDRADVAKRSLEAISKGA